MYISNPTFTVHSHSTLYTFTHMQESPDDEVRGWSPIHEEEIMVFKSCILESPTIIQLPV